MNKAIKYTLVGFASLLILLVISIPFIPAETYRAEIETQISQTIGLDVSLGELSLTSLPTPGIKIETVVLSEKDKTLLQIASIHLVPSLPTLLSDKPVIRKIHLSGIQIHADDISRLTQLAPASERSDSDTSPAVQVARITGDNNVLILDKKQSIGPFDFRLLLNKQSTLQSLNIALEQQVFNLDIKANNQQYDITVRASDWTPPIQPALKLNSLHIEGQLLKNRLHLEQIKIVAYEGTATGNLVLDKPKQWQLDSRLEVTSLKLGKLLQAINNHSLDGTASSQLTIRAQAESPAEFINNFHIEGNVTLVNGHIYEADLQQAARSLSSEWKAGGQTPFDKFETHINIRPDTIKLSDLLITSDLLGAEGNLRIHQLKTLDGEISVGLNDPTGLVTMPLMIAGTVDEPKVRPTDEAIASGVIGTAILGPGVGTAVGIKAGEIMGKIGSLFGSDDDEKKPAKKE